MTNFIDKDELKEGLLANIDSFVNNEFSGKTIKHYSSGIRVGTNGSLTVNHDGQWYSHEEMRGGADLIGLIMWHHECDFRKALEIGKEFLEGRPISSEKTNTSNKINHEQKRKDILEYAWMYWKRAEDIYGTLAEDYLLRIRNIKSISDYARRKLRFLKHHKHSPTGEYYPALIVKVQKPDGSFGGIFRVYLDPNGKGKIRDSPKMRLGSVEGSVIRFSPIANKIIICEGVEDALTILCACPDKAVWCGIGGNMSSVIFPPEIKHVTIAADNDPAGEQFAQKLAKRLVNDGRKVSICKPSNFKDFNSIINGE